MKKFIVVLLTVCAIQTSYSQTEKGRMFIGGNFNLSGHSNSNFDSLSKYDNYYNGFTITPNYGYFIADNFAIGANINIGTSVSTRNYENTSVTASLPSKYTNKSTLFSYGLGGFACYYTNITDKFKFYFNGSLNYNNSTQKSKYSNNDSNYVYPVNSPASQEIQTNRISLDVTPGIIYFITPKFGIQASFGNMHFSYSSSKNKSLLNDNQNKSSYYGINLNLSSFYFGVNYFF